MINKVYGSGRVRKRGYMRVCWTGIGFVFIVTVLYNNEMYYLISVFFHSGAGESGKSTFGKQLKYVRKNLLKTFFSSIASNYTEYFTRVIRGNARKEIFTLNSKHSFFKPHHYALIICLFLNLFFWEIFVLESFTVMDFPLKRLLCSEK